MASERIEFPEIQNVEFSSVADADKCRRIVKAYAHAVRVQTLEDAAKRCEAMIESLTASMHKASAVGRVVVAACRQSDIETLERAAKAIREMKSGVAAAPKKEGQ